MVSRGGVIVTAVVGTAGAVLALIVAKLWPSDSDALVTGSGRLLRRWRRFVGIDD